MTRGKSKHHIILILFFIIIAVFSLYEDFGKEKRPKIIPPATTHEKKAERVLRERVRPKVAIVIDDLGPNKHVAEKIISLKAPLTFSVLPQQTYSAWIAEEGHRVGHDVIAHIPMETEKSYRLGEGGLYTWMTDKEISETLNKDITSIPHAIGVSNHMGSAFTQDERAMQSLIVELRKKKLFFLDSLTSSGSVGFHLAKMNGIEALKRDIFLDDNDDPSAIKMQWEKMITVANKKGYAVLLAHPRENTIEFLRRALTDNNKITIVPVSELVRR